MSLNRLRPRKTPYSMRKFIVNFAFCDPSKTEHECTVKSGGGGGRGGGGGGSGESDSNSRGSEKRF